MTTKSRKVRILALCDSPTAATGFAQVSRNVLKGLAKTGKYEIDVIGINYYGDFYNREEHPYNIYPAQPQGYMDMYGRMRLLNAISGKEAQAGLKPPWDIIFTIQDPFIMEGLGLPLPIADQIKVTEELWKRNQKPDMWFKWMAYWPVDASVKENWVTRSMAIPDYPVAYCDWGKAQILKWDRKQFDLNFTLKITEGQMATKAKMLIPSLKDRIKVIPHGVDTRVFKPLSEVEKRRFRKEYFKGFVKDSTFLVINVSRNQPRKDIARTLAAFAAFKKIVKDSHLYLHMKSNDAGGSIDEIARNFDLALGRDYSVPDEFVPGIGFPVEQVNKMYNAADLAVTTTLGEGWGFITTEAMATKTPIAAPAITSMIDIFGIKGPADVSEEFYKNEEIRGVPVKSGSTPSEWICLGLEDNERIRPLTNVDDLVWKMLWVYRNPEKVKEITDRAYKWVLNLDWSHIIKEWDLLLTEAFEQLEKDRAYAIQIDKTGRNDPCPCGSGRKFKKCHGSSEAVNRFRDWIEGEETGEKNAKI